MSANVRLGLSSTALAAGDLMLHPAMYQKLLAAQSMMIAPSRSGSTSEVLLAVEQAVQNQNVPILAITCVKDSPLAAKAGLTLELPWAFDKSVCQTRSVVNLYAANLLLVAYMAGDNGLVGEIQKMIEAGDDYIRQYEAPLKAMIQDGWSQVVILADGEMQGIAAEAALAMTEIAQLTGQYYHVLDVRHGPMVMIGKDTLSVVCLSAGGFEHQKKLVGELVARGSKVITYSDEALERIEGVRLAVTSGFPLSNGVCGIPFLFIAQALSYYKAVHQGNDPDYPEGLDPWIKL